MRKRWERPKLPAGWAYPAGAKVFHYFRTDKEWSDCGRNIDWTGRRLPILPSHLEREVCSVCWQAARNMTESAQNTDMP